MEHDNIKLYYWYKAFEDELIEKYYGKYLLIGPNKEATPYDEFDKAYTDGCEKYGYGNFLVPQCVPEKFSMTYSPIGHYVRIFN